MNECIECDRPATSRNLCALHLAELQHAEHLDDYPDRGDDDDEAVSA